MHPGFGIVLRRPLRIPVQLPRGRLNLFIGFGQAQVLPLPGRLVTGGLGGFFWFGAGGMALVCGTAEDGHG